MLKQIKTQITNFLLIVGILLSIYGYIQKQFGLFVCKTDGCAIANSLIKIEGKWLYLIAILFFSFLFYIKNTKINWLKNKFELLLFSGIIFEIIIFSNMVFVYSEFCKECAKMIILLITIGLVVNYKNMIFVIAAVSAMFLLNPIEDKITFEEEKTLITKVDCPHCIKTKQYLKENNIKYKELNYKKAIGILNTFNIKTVPVLILKNESEIKVISGDVKIINCVNELKEDKEPLINELKSNTEIFNSIDMFNSLNLNNQKETEIEGCRIDKPVLCDN